MERFIKGTQYRFIKGFTYDLPGLRPGMAPIVHVECCAGDLATFDGPNMGMGRFYVRTGDTFALILVKPREAFKLFEEV